MSSLVVSARLERAKLAQKRKHEVHLMLTLEGLKPEGATRKPLSLIAAIDVSGSMGEEHGQKIDKAKMTLQKLVDHMTDKDTLGVVAFSDSVWTVVQPKLMTDAAKTLAKVEIAKLRHLASTNLSGATIDGLQMLNGLKERKADEILRTFLLTDGQPTCGETDHGRLVEIVGEKLGQGSLSCFGYGTNYGVELLDAMARRGKGNLHHIQTPDQCAMAFGKELGGLLACVAQAVKVTVKTKKGARILEVLNDFDVKGSGDQSEAVITVDDVYGSEKRKLLLRMELDEMDTTGPRPYKFADVSVKFHDLLGKKDAEEEASVKVEFVPEDEAQKDADIEVAEQLALLGAAKAQEEAMQFANAGDFQKAQGVLRTARLRAENLGTKFGAAIAGDLGGMFENCSDQHTYHQTGGGVQLSANSKSYSRGRGSTKGASEVLDGSVVMDFAKTFAADPVAPPAAPVVPPQAPAPTAAADKLSKSRHTRS